jgi:PAS domain S-box-containing protein
MVPRHRILRTLHPAAGIGARVLKRRILIVENDGIAARALEQQLTALGYGITGIAATREAANALAAPASPDLLLVQLAPGIQLEDFRRYDLERDAAYPIVFITTPAGEATLREAGVTEPERYLVRPFSTRELHAVLELALCRHAARRAATEIENRFFEDSIDMLCLLDFNGHFKRLNPAWERTLGFTREELMARPFIEFVHPEDRERTLNQNAQVRSGGHALGFENRYLCKDGSYRWFHWNAASNSSDRVIYSVARDVTNNKLAEAERERLLRHLQDALAEVKTLRAILPICSYCKKVRDDEDYWHSIENYISIHTPTMFSHGICPSCMKTEVEPRLERLMRESE